MYSAFRFSQIVYLGESPWIKGRNRSSSDVLRVMPIMPSNMKRIQHLRLFIVLCQFPKKNVFKVLSIHPISNNSSANKDRQSWLQLSILAYSRIIKSVHHWRIKAIRKSLSAKALLQPVLLLIQDYDFYENTHERSIAKQFSLVGKRRLEMYLTGTARWSSDYDIISLDICFILSDNQTATFLLDDLFHIVVQFDTSAFGFNLIAQVDTHMLAPFTRLLLLQAVLDIDQVLKGLGLADVVQEVKHADLGKLYAQDDSNGCFNHHFYLCEADVIIQPTFYSHRVPIISQLTILGVKGRDFLGHSINFPDSPLHLKESYYVNLIRDSRRISPDFILELNNLFALRIHIDQLIFRLNSELYRMMLSWPYESSSQIEVTAIDVDGFSPSSKIIIGLKQSYLSCWLLFQDTMSSSQP